jgi:hypothetical protein
MTLDAYVGLLGKLDTLPLLDATDEATRNQVACMRMEREALMEEHVRILPDPGAE